MNRIARLFAIGFVIGLNLSIFTNCNGFVMTAVLPSQDDSGLPPGVLRDQIGETIPTKVLTGEQMLVSFSQLTRVESSNPRVKAEFASRNGALADAFSLSAVNAPLLIGVANLTSRFCDEAITKEQALSATARRLFGEVNFSAGPGSLSANSFQALVNNLALKFWGRDATPTEQDLIGQGRKDFEDNQAGNKETAAVTRNLVLYTCTGMLSAFDSITF